MGETAKTQVCPHLCPRLGRVLAALAAWDAITDVRRLVSGICSLARLELVPTSRQRSFGGNLLRCCCLKAFLVACPAACVNQHVATAATIRRQLRTSSSAGARV